jgi:orotidine-5'-phosphate decarboxylase
MNANVGLLINSSRNHICFNGNDFAEKSRAEALKMQQEMEQIVSLKFKN